jgi:hypothetical protein
MDWNFQQLKYGWYALAGVAVTGATIFVALNTRQQIEQVDIIELVLGLQERCLATQYATNPLYYVSPLTYVATYKDTNYTYPGKAVATPQWISVGICYTTYWPDAVARVVSYTNYYFDMERPTITWAESWTATGGYVWVTNSTWRVIPSFEAWENRQNVTNLIGYHIDRNLLIEIDTKIKALVTNYVDTNTLYNGTTNIAMLTVTGLWASLGIGDKTNKFTRTPAWTNPISTNWIVNYTSYWPSTNGTPTNVIYTSEYQQVVNYAESWTATGGHVWVTASNWASEVVTITNNATYGDYPWQIYVEDVQERYKVLNALKVSIAHGTSYYRLAWGSASRTNWELAKASAETSYATNITYEKIGMPYSYSISVQSYGEWDGWNNYAAALYSYSMRTAPTPYCTNFNYISLRSFARAGGYNPQKVYNDNGVGISSSIWTEISFPFGIPDGQVPIWLDDPTGYETYKGFNYFINPYAEWQFNYATNRYWE